MLQGREPEGRRDDRVLYTAITNPEVLRPWLEAIERLHVPLAGIHSAAVFSGNLLAELDLVFPHALLVTFTPGEAMRQTYFRDREIALQPPHAHRPRGGPDAGRDARRGDHAHLAVPGQPAPLRPRGPPRGVRAGAPEGPARDRAGAARLRADPVPPARHRAGRRQAGAEAPAARLDRRGGAGAPLPAPPGRRTTSPRPELRARRHAAQRAPAAQPGLGRGARRRRRVGRLRASRRCCRPTSIDQRTAQQLQSLNREYDEIVRSLPSRGVGGAAMRDSVAFYNGNIRGFPTIADFLVPVSRGARRASRACACCRSRGRRANDPKVTPALRDHAVRGTPPVRALRARRRGGAAGAAPRAPDAPFASGRYQVALLEATVRVDGVDFRGALAEVDRLAADIARVPGYTRRGGREPARHAPRRRGAGHARRAPRRRPARRASRCASCASGRRHEHRLLARRASARCAPRGSCSPSRSPPPRRSARADTGSRERDKREGGQADKRLREARSRLDGARRERDNLHRVGRGVPLAGRPRHPAGRAPAGPDRAGGGAAHAATTCSASTTRSHRSAHCPGRPSPRSTCSPAA